MAQGKRERARDSRGRPIPGLYVRDGKFSCAYQDGEPPADGQPPGDDASPRRRGSGSRCSRDCARDAWRRRTTRPSSRSSRSGSRAGDLGAHARARGARLAPLPVRALGAAHPGRDAFGPRADPAGDARALLLVDAGSRVQGSRRRLLARDEARAAQPQPARWAEPRREAEAAKPARGRTARRGVAGAARRGGRERAMARRLVPRGLRRTPGGRDPRGPMGRHRPRSQHDHDHALRAPEWAGEGSEEPGGDPGGSRSCRVVVAGSWSGSSRAR